MANSTQLRVLHVLRTLSACAVLALSGCGGDLPALHFISGEVSGLAGKGLVLQNNGADDLSISGNGRFIFKSDLASDAAYAVTVKQQPGSPAQTCTVSKGSGRTGNKNVVDIQVACVTDAAPIHPVGGSVAGLVAQAAGAGLVLQNNGGDDLAVTADGAFAFRTQLAEGSAYAVTIKTQPASPSQVCSVSAGSGTMGRDAVAHIRVDCMRQVAPVYLIGGTVSGLAGSQLLLQNNEADELAISANGRFAFPAALPDGAAYSVTVKSAPSSPAQSCIIRNGSGAVRGADVADIAIDCVTQPMYTVGGNVAGLNGSGLVLQNHGEELAIAANGRFLFANSFAGGAPYSVAVKNNPASPAQTCTLDHASGTIGSSNVTDVGVTCQDVVIPTYSIGGTVSGLVGTGLVLQNGANGETLAVPADGSFVFGTRLRSGVPFSIGIKTQPGVPPQACTVSNGSGTVSSSNVTNITITCPAPRMHYAYVTSLVNTAVYKVDDASGALTATGSAVPQGGILAGTHPAGTRFFYLADVARNAVHAYTIDVASGALAEVAGSPFASGASQPQAMTAAPNGKFLYAANRNSNAITAFAIDPATGMLSAVGTPVGSGLYPLALAVTPDNKFLIVANYLDNVLSRYAIDAASGALARLPDTPIGFASRFMALGGGGKFLYMTTSANNNRLVYAFALDAGADLTAVPGSPFSAGNGAQNVETDPSGRYLFVTNETDGTLSSFAIDAATGALAPLGAALAAGGLPEGVAVDPNGKFVYVASQSNRAVFVYGIDGAASSVAPQGPSPTPATPFAVTVVNQ